MSAPSTLALLEVLDRDGHVRQALRITQWPITVGRSLDCDLVLDDPHIAPVHFRVAADDSARVVVQIAQTINGIRADGQHLAAGGQLVVGDKPLRIDAGDVHLRLRLAEHAIEAERPFAIPLGFWRTARPILVTGVLVLAALLFETWLQTDPDEFTRTLGSVLPSAIGTALLWCGGWALVSKVFTRRSHLWWHARVLLGGVLANQVVGALAPALAFVLSWAWISDFAFVALYSIAATMLYFHALGTEPRHPQRLRAAAVGMLAAAIGLHLWFNQQNHDRFGDELYMSHLLPPSWRLARTVESDAFIARAQPLRTKLEKLAKKPDENNGSGASDDED